MRKWLTDRKDYWQPSSKEFRALLVSIFFLILGFVTILIFRGLLKLQQDAVLVAILLVPVLIYLILSGKLLEINAGGVKAKFNATAEESVFSKDEFNKKPIEARGIEIAGKGSPEQLQEFLESISNAMFITLTVKLGKGQNYYQANALLHYLRELSHYQSYIFLVILDQNDKVFAYLTSWHAMRILQRETLSDQVSLGDIDRFVTAINLGQEIVLLGYELVTQTVKTTDTNIFALEKMTELNMDAIIVTNEDGKLKGVVERAQVLSKLILALTK